MNRNLQFTILLIIFLLSSVFPLMAQKNYKIPLIFQGNTYALNSKGNDMVELKSLKEVFGFRYKTGSNTSYVLINGVHYGDGVVFRGGSYFIPLKKFLKFFLAIFSETNAGVLTVKDSGILNNRKVKTSDLLVSTGRFDPVITSVIIAGDAIFIESGAFSKMTGKVFSLNRLTGVALLGGKSIGRWIEKDGRVYLYREDLESAYGDALKLAKPVPVKETSETDSQRQKAAEIKDRIWVTYEGQAQYGSGNPDYPVGYRIAITVRNRFRDPIKIHPSGLIMVDQKGNSYQGQILGSSGLSSTGTLIDIEGMISPATAPLNYFTVQPRDSGYLVIDFLLPKDAESSLFIFQYEGVTGKYSQNLHPIVGRLKSEFEQDLHICLSDFTEESYKYAVQRSDPSNSLRHRLYVCKFRW